MIDVFLKVGLISKARISYVAFPIVVAFALYSDVMEIWQPVFAATIDTPSTVEAPLTQPRQVPAKLNNGGFQNREFGLKNVNDAETFIGPLNGGWIETKQFGFNSVSENCGGVESPSTPLSPKSKPVRNEPSKTNTSAPKQPEIGLTQVETEKVHPSFWLLIAAIVISLCHDNTNYSMKHNE